MVAEDMAVDVSQDWLRACDVQRRFMEGAKTEFDGVDCAARCRQVWQVGGDCFDFAPLASGQLAVSVGDASGKGFAAALMISSVQSSLRTAAQFTGTDTARTLEAVNRQVFGSSLADRYATLFYGVFDSTDRTLRYVNAGHNPPMVLRRDGSVEWLKSGGAPVGLFSDSTYEEGFVRLDPGDLVVAYTDGMVEAVNPRGDEWGVEGLLEAASSTGGRSAHVVVDAIFRSLDEFCRGSLADDATVMVIRVS